MNYRQINIFFILASEGSFSKAESKAFLTKQALKKQLDVLEDELGFRLFTRSNQGLDLTPKGQIFHKGMLDIQTELDDLISKCRSYNE